MQAPILQMLGGQTAANPQAAQIAAIKQGIARLRAMQNPQAALHQMMQQRSPGMAQAMEYIKKHGGDPKKAFETLAAERGIDPAEITGMIG